MTPTPTTLRPGRAGTASTIADQATPLLIDRPVSYDIYRNVHKGIRAELFAVVEQLGRVDPDDRGAARSVAARFRTLQHLLVRHAAHEDDFLDDAIEQALGGQGAALAAAHVVLEARIERVGAILDAGLAATDRRAELHMAYLEMAAFVADYLQHQDDEERIVMRALDATFPAAVLADLDARIVASIPKDVM